MEYELQTDILEKISKERRRQEDEYPEDRYKPLTFWNTILGEEVGEVARAVLERKPNDLEEELIHVAAVAIAWLELLKSNNEDNIPHYYYG